MKSFKFFMLTMFLTLTLEAAYLRSIRVSTFNTQVSAEKELIKLKSFVKSHKNIVLLQEKWGFEATLRVSGKYNIVIIAPLRNKKVLQEVIDTVRIEYPDVYVRKMKKSDIREKIKIEPKVEVKPDPVVIVNIEKLIEVVEILEVVEVVPQKVIKEVVVEEIIIKKVQKKKVEEKKIIKTSVIKKEVLPVEVEPLKIKENSEEFNIYKILFFFVLIAFLILSYFLYLTKGKREKENQLKRDSKLKNDKKNSQFSSQIQNNENFLFEAQTSMSFVIQYSNLLLEFGLTVIQKDYVQRIKNSSEGLLNVINNTSDISKIQIGELKINNIDFNIISMINDVTNIIKLEARQNNVSFKVDVEEDIPTHVIGDSIYLKQVLISLLTHSVKYTRDGEVTLTLKKVYSYSHAITLNFVITDTGIGMSPEQVDSIVDTEENNTSRNLSISKQLIQRMNGDMKIYSTVDVGTTFTFNIKFDLQ